MHTTREPASMGYLDLQAFMGATKHMGGQQATRELVELCQIKPGMTVLDIGCGAGATPSYLVKECGCRVIGIDLRPAMVALAEERAQRDGLQQDSEFKVADARQLPFEDNSFEAVLCESVASFIPEKAQAVAEFARVLKPGGHAGLNEQFWRKLPPPERAKEILDFWELPPGLPSDEGWQELLAQAGLEPLPPRRYQLEVGKEMSELKRYSPGDFLRMIGRISRLYLSSPEFRAYMSRRRRLPKDTFQWMGYGIFVGKK